MTALDLSGEQVVATYQFQGSKEDAEAAVRHLCVEETIEFPADLVTSQEILDGVLAHADESTNVGPDVWEAKVRFSVEVSGFELPQLLNMLFGNISLRGGVRLLDVSLPPLLLDKFRGPRFGVPGLREMLRVPTRPMLATALKPMGLPLTELAAMAGDFAEHGIDMIKDDHGLASQPFALFRPRVQMCAEAIAEANERSGRRALYFASLNVPSERLHEAAHWSKSVGAAGIMCLPGLHGTDSMRALAADDELALPVMAHPSFLGSFVSAGFGGIDHAVLLGTLTRLAGADVSIFPAHGGRFSFPPEQCAAIGEALRAPLGGLPAAFPAPAGGMTLERAGEMVDFYGRDVVLLIGGELHRGDRRERARQLAEAVS